MKNESRSDDEAGIVDAKSAEAYGWLRRRIVDGHYGADSHLRESHLARQLGMSRTPIRSAIQALAADGLVELVPQRGAYVRRWTADDIEGAYGIRAALEGFCAGRAATTMAREDVARLQGLQDELERRAAASEDPATFVRLNAAFHRAIVEEVRNPRIAAVLDDMIGGPPGLNYTFWSVARERDVSIIFHRQIVEAISSGDPMRAESAMRTHVLSVRSLFAQRERHAEVQGMLACHEP